MLVFLYDVISCDFSNIKNCHGILRFWRTWQPWFTTKTAIKSTADTCRSVESSFSFLWVGANLIWDPPLICQEELIQFQWNFIQLLKNLFKRGWRLKKRWHHLLYTNFISIFVTSSCQKVQKPDENS